MPRFPERLPDFSAAIEAFIDEVDFRRAPVRFDLPHIHGQKSHAARANLGRHLGVMLDVMVLDKGWHVGFPVSAKSTMNHNHRIRIADGARFRD